MQARARYQARTVKRFQNDRLPNRPQKEKEITMSELTEQIKDKVEVIAELLKDGKHVELCENKDGLRIISMDRKVVK